MPKKPLHAKLLNSFGDIYKTLRFLYHHIQKKRKNGNYYYPFTETFKGRPIYILANGPSLNKDINELMSNDIILKESLVVNFFIESDLFMQIQPKYYCLADPVFNEENFLTERARAVYKKLDEVVCWPLTLFVWKDAVKMVSNIMSNSYINIVGLPTLRFEGFEKKRYKYFKKGIAGPT